jgi:hypothetical protein
MRIKAFLLFLLFIPASAVGAGFTSVGAGGGGWLHSGAILPTDSDVIVVGADISGVYRTNNFGTRWFPRNDGLLNADRLQTNHVEDLMGIDYDGWVGFYAATRGGIYCAEESGDWESMTPADEGYYFKVQYQVIHKGVPFTCLDWSDTNLVVAGAGGIWWDPDYPTCLSNQTSYYPLLDNITEYGSGLEDGQWTVWTLDLDDVDPTWGPDTSGSFGAARDISVAIRNDTTYIAVGTSEGIYLKSPSGWTSIGGSLYDDNLSCWSLHLTNRGTLYAAMGKTIISSSCTTGVYRLFDIGNPTGWTWVGNGDLLPPAWESLKQTGARAYEHLIYMSVLDGDSSAPDLLYLATRASGRGLYRGYQPYSPGGQCDWTHKLYSTGTPPDLSFYYRDSADSAQELDIGWLDHQEAYVVFHPIVSEYHRGVVALHLGGRLHVSADTANSWTQCYTTEEETDHWKRTGYKELAVADVAFMSDGRAISSTGDEGLFRSYDTDMDTWHPLDPPGNAPSRETNTVEVRPDWRGTGKDALLVICGDVMQGGTSCKLYWIDDNDTWHNLTVELMNNSRYKFRDFVFTDDDTCFIAYAKYDDDVGNAGADLVEFGVLRGDRDPWNAWTWTAWNDSLLAVYSPVPRNACGADLLYHEPTGRILLAARETNSLFAGDTTATWLPGALYMLDSSNDSEWEIVSGGPGTYWQDFRCLAQPPDGDVIYAGLRGAWWTNNFYGSVLKCENPLDSLGAWTAMINADSSSCAFGFTAPEGTGWTPLQANRKLTDVRAIAVDPGDEDIIFAGLWSAGFMEQVGLWKYDGSTWSELSDGKHFDGISINALKVSTATEDSMLVVGTHGMELYLYSTDDDPGPDDILFGARASSGLKLLHVNSELGGRTEIEFALEQPARVKMQVFDVRGRLVHRREADFKKAGQCRLFWDGSTRPGRPCASGIYFLRLSAGDVKADRKFMLIR